MGEIIPSVNRLDANETLLFKRQLEFVKTKTYDKKYRNLKSSILIPISTEAPAGADFIIWYSYSKAGVAKIIADYAHDFPRVDDYAEENQSKIYSIGSSYGYSIKEIRRAQMAKVNLSTKRADTCRRANDELVDRLCWYGDADYNLQGFFDYPGISSFTVPTGTGGVPWSTKTSDEIIVDLTGMQSAVSVPTNGREEIDTILLPREQYNLIKNKRMEGNTDKTVLTFFLSNNQGLDGSPAVQIMPLDELAGAGAAGADRMMAYVRDADHLTQEIPQPFEQLEEEKKGMEYKIPCHSEFAGIIIYYPQSVVYGDGI
jgi:hypothetical protein